MNRTNGHIWRNNGYNAYHCTRCGISDYGADFGHEKENGIGYVTEYAPCQGRETHACPTQHNGHTHGTCREQFASVQAAEEHWTAAHKPAS